MKNPKLLFINFCNVQDCKQHPDRRERTKVKIKVRNDCLDNNQELEYSLITSCLVENSRMAKLCGDRIFVIHKTTGPTQILGFLTKI